ncbi:hypothetical protein [Rhizobium sp. BK418]|uniref:hypothetical protein n=1 Tax=Rhizobium sp. BK418 TaxID=2512120 RepID=UPI00104D3510|nr:hypothetical protein [Rhizobium sp. BK418]TCR97800.1 hypothetical protein EV281_11017 [Rhizobium sp. BK418]
MICYFQGCNETGVTKEHIPPRSFFPEDERHQLLTVKACKTHNNDKSTNDLYVLAQICMHSSPSNRAREVFLDRVAPQLSHNNDALRRLLSKGAVQVPGGVLYPVDQARFDEFFTALCCGLVYKSQKAQLPPNYRISHIYHQLLDNGSAEWKQLVAAVDEFYGAKPETVLDFGRPDAQNERIYTVEIYGVPHFGGSITIVHRFFGVFKVTSMLTRLVER